MDGTFKTRPTFGYHVVGGKEGEAKSKSRKPSAAKPVLHGDATTKAQRRQRGEHTRALIVEVDSTMDMALHHFSRNVWSQCSLWCPPARLLICFPMATVPAHQLIPHAHEAPNAPCTLSFLLPAATLRGLSIQFKDNSARGSSCSHLQRRVVLQWTVAAFLEIRFLSAAHQCAGHTRKSTCRQSIAAQAINVKANVAIKEAGGWCLCTYIVWLGLLQLLLSEGESTGWGTHSAPRTFQSCGLGTHSAPQNIPCILFPLFP